MTGVIDIRDEEEVTGEPVAPPSGVPPNHEAPSLSWDAVGPESDDEDDEVVAGDEAGLR
ncbi:hypothetical protein [Actinoplanes sp. NPDC051851]|uniref:hypothetical protein n=1 Tax=Actinoplanes sp. NPDC051851 TaxID=3154753 RepID=UPI00343068BA